MGTISVTPEEKAELARENTLIRELPGADGASRADYHNPVTGQEMAGPMDPYHMTRRLRQGWRLGPAPKELQEKWLVREQELKEADDLMIEEHKNSDEGQQEREVWEQNFSEAVATAVDTAVTKVLEKLGHGEAKTEVSTDDPRQLNMFAPIDAPSESDTKHEVSPASRPYLRLVE